MTANEASGGGGGIQPIGDAFQPNLAMGGGSFHVPFDLPSGPGGYAPKLDLLYNTGFGNGVFGIGWMLSAPFIQRKRRSPFAPHAEVEYAFSGADTLVRLADGRYTPFVQSRLEMFERDGSSWFCRAANLVEMRFGSTSASRVEGVVDDEQVIARWLVDRITFPGDRSVEFDYEAEGAQRTLRAIRWSLFRLDFEYDTRPDPYSQFDLGFEIRTSLRCARVVMRHARLGQIRTYAIGYQESAGTGASLLDRIQISGWRDGDETAAAPLRFGYTAPTVAPTIERFRSTEIAPPPLGESVALLDYRGVALPGVLRLDGIEGTYWENRGGLEWGPPERLRAIPRGVDLADEGVRFADLAGDGTADLIVDDAYYANDPELGFRAPRPLRLAPSFRVSDPNTHLIDLDGDGATDLLTFRDGTPLAFFNERTDHWRGPVPLPVDSIPRSELHGRLRFEDMTGDGMTDLVLIHGGDIRYWPGLGNGRWGEERRMPGAPQLDLTRGIAGVELVDVDGDGAADLVVIGQASVAIYLNRGGEGFGAATVIERTPRLGRYQLADMKGSGTAGVLWTAEAFGSSPHEYWFLDLGGGKPNLLSRIDNGAGLVTEIEYSTSVGERTADLAEGRRWSGYLPFAVHVIKRMTMRDVVTGEQQVTEYRYHDGHFDRRHREYLGFAQVDSIQRTSDAEADIHQRVYFHNRGESAASPAFVAGKGQPRRTELLDDAGEIRRIDESTWDERGVPGTAPDRPAWLAVETRRTTQRIDGGTVYASEVIDFEHDEHGGITREHRRGEWRDRGNLQVDELIIETRFAAHPVHGATSFQSRVRKSDGTGRVLKRIDHHYDGPAFEGLPLGEVTNGWVMRQTELALTSREIAEAYDGVAPAQLATLYRIEDDPQLGQVYVKDLRRHRLDTVGNQLETLDSLGHRTTVTMDADSIHPISIEEDGFGARTIDYDPLVQEASRIVDVNGHATTTRYDALGGILEVSRAGAVAGKPTEVYERRRDVVPNLVIQRQRIEPSDDAAGFVKYEYLDGSGRTAQIKRLAENGRWAVDKHATRSLRGRELRERPAYFTDTPAFESSPSTLPERVFRYDFASRVIEERLFSGRHTRTRHVGNEAWFWDPDRATALASDPSTPPGRISRSDAWDRVVSIEERDGDDTFEQRRHYDPLNRLARIADTTDQACLESWFDLWGNRIRVRSIDCGETRYVFDAAGHEVMSSDASGRTVVTSYDSRGRLHEVRAGLDGPIEERHLYDTGDGANLGGRLARVEGAFGAVDYSYSASGLPTQIRRRIAGDDRVFEVGFSYNSKRDVTSVTYPDGNTISYHYTPGGALRAIDGVIEEIDYTANGLRERISFANGIETRQQYSQGDDLLHEIVTRTIDGGIKYQHLVHHLDPVGQVLSIEDRSTVTGKFRNDQTFEYDGRTRLVRATGRGAGGDYEFRYRYDALGNLVATDEMFGNAVEYGTGADRNRMVRRPNAPDYTYDAAGRMTRDPAVGTYHYDARGRLSRVERTDGGVVEYLYDHNGRRVSTRVTEGDATRVQLVVENIYVVDATTTTKVVFDGDRRLAIIPSAGDPLLHHTDRIGNLNVVSNLRTGAFVGHDEYTPYGRLSISLTIAPHFSFQGGRFEDGVDLVLLGARYYRPAIGRFITPDRYLMVNQKDIAALLGAANLYLYALGNPTNFTDPTGQIVFLFVLLMAALIGAILGAIGAAVNGARTWDEWFLWILGGAIGGMLVASVVGGIAAAIVVGGCAAAGGSIAAIHAVVWWMTVSLLGSAITPALDKTNNYGAWFVSFLFKWANSPVATTLSLVLVLFAAGWGGARVDLRRGMVFVANGQAMGTVTIGGVGWAGSNQWTGNQINDPVARHESYHSRTVTALGEFGFYFTYLVIGGPWGAYESGVSSDWSKVNNNSGSSQFGCGNPFEKTARSITGNPATPKSSDNC